MALVEGEILEYIKPGAPSWPIKMVRRILLSNDTSSVL
jgi:hypothetical protein